MCKFSNNKVSESGSIRPNTDSNMHYVTGSLYNRIYSEIQRMFWAPLSEIGFSFTENLLNIVEFQPFLRFYEILSNQTTLA